MECIKLTEEHKKKLLEMCKVLFPQYDEYTFWNANFIGMYHYDEYGEESPYDNISIHWFEFVLTHLCQKMFGNELSGEHCLGNISEAQYEAAYIISHSHIHPVDLLYEKFKRM